MAFVPIVNTCKVVVEYFSGDDSTQCVNVMHALCGTTPSAAHLTDIGGAFATMQHTLLTTIMPADLDALGVQVTDLNSITGAQVVVPPLGGSGSGASSASGVCALVKLTSGERGRSFRGRVFIGPLESTAFTGDVVAGDIPTIITTAFNTLKSDLLALTPASDLVIASRKLGLSTIVTGIQVESKPAYQRRRGGR